MTCAKRALWYQRGQCGVGPRGCHCPHHEQESRWWSSEVGKGRCCHSFLVLFCWALERFSPTAHLLAQGTSRSRWWKHGLVFGESEAVLKWPGSALTPSCVVAGGGQFWPTGVCYRVRASLPFPRDTLQTGRAPTLACSTWNLGCKSPPAHLAWPPRHQHGGARSELPPLLWQAEHDSNGGAFSKTKLCKRPFWCRAHLSWLHSLKQLLLICSILT